MSDKTGQAPHFRVAEFWSSSTPGTKVRMVAEGADVTEWPKRDDFLRWADALTASDIERLEALVREYGNTPVANVPRVSKDVMRDIINMKGGM